jgi:tRNA(Ile)-lysidine synthase
VPVPGRDAGGQDGGAGLLARFVARAERDGWLPAGTLLLLAVSGGADSMALWDLLERAGRWRLALFHLDHGLRDDAPLDADLIRDRAAVATAAGRAPAALAIEHTDIPALARRWHCSIELAGRRHRYARLRELAMRLGAGAVLTAHHRDDQVETVLANLLRGAGPVGRAGIAPRRLLAPGLPLVRPLLSFTRAELREHCLVHAVPWREDSTNQDTRLHRNFLRHGVLPTLAAGVPGIADELAALAAASQAELLDSEEAVEAAWRRGLGADDLLVDGVAALGIDLRRQVWRRLLQHLLLPIERRHLDALDRLARGEPGRRLALGRWLLLRRPHAVAWELQHPPSSSAQVAMSGPGSYQRCGETIACAVGQPPERPMEPPDAAWLALEACSWPLEWRPSRPGERWQPLGCPGRQTVVKFLSSRGQSSRLRPLTPVVADANGVLWVPGFGIAERAKVLPTTREALHLRWTPCPLGEAATVCAPPEDADDP